MIVLSNVVAPTDGIRLIQGQVAAHIDDETAGEGELIVAESSLTWISRATGQGLSLTYPSIILHAVSRDPGVFPEECIYVLVDAKNSDIGIRSSERPTASRRNDVEGDDEEAEEASDDEKSQLAIRFVPQDKSILQNIYQQMCECQELNPDEDDDFSDDMDPFNESDSDEEHTDDSFLNGAGEGQQNILYIRNRTTDRPSHGANGDTENVSDSEQMDEG